MTDQSFYSGEEVLQECSVEYLLEITAKSMLTLKVVSIPRTSPAISASEKSTLAFQSWVIKPRRSWRAVNLCNISYIRDVVIDEHVSFNGMAYLNCDEVFQRLAHLQALNVKMTGM